MQFKYTTTTGGAYTHVANEAAFTISENAVLGDGGHVKAVVKRWTIDGLLISSDGTHATLKTELAALKTAYSVHGGDLLLLSPDSSTAESLLNADSTYGTRITNLSFPESGKGTAEYANYRNYIIVIEAEYITNSSLLISFSETVRTTGGGPRIVYPEVITGKPEPQTTMEFTTYKIIQSGSSTQLSAFPDPPRPKWPSKRHAEQDQIAQFTGGTTTLGQVEHTTTWSYSFESANKLA